LHKNIWHSTSSYLEQPFDHNNIAAAASTHQIEDNDCYSAASQTPQLCKTLQFGFWGKSLLFISEHVSNPQYYDQNTYKSWSQMVMKSNLMSKHNSSSAFGGNSADS
jgi:hypothetical protein